MSKPKSPNRQKLDFDTVREIALKLPGVEDSKSYGAPSLKVHGELIAGIPVNKSAEPGSVGLRISIDRRAELLETAPEIYYAPEHYINYPMVLVRLSRIDLEALRDIIHSAYRFVTTEKRAKKRTPLKPKTKRPRSRS